MMEEPLDREPDDSLGDEHHEEHERKRRKRFIIAVGSLLILGGVLLFFDNALRYFTDAAPKSAGQVDKQGAQVSRVTEQQWQEQAPEIKGLLEKGKVDEALRLLQGLLGKNPEIPEIHYLAGAAFLRQGRIQSAYDQFKKAVALRDDYYEAQIKLGEIYLLGGDYKAARDISVRLAKAGEYLQDGLLLESEVARAEGDLDQALQKAAEAVTGPKKTTSTRSSAYLAELFLQKGDRIRAEKAIQNLDPGSLDAEGLLSVAKFYLGAGNEGKAVNGFQQALARYPDSAEVNYSYAQYLFKKERFQEASEYYKKAMQSMPEAQIIAYHLTQCYMAAGLMDESRARIEALARKYPNSMLTLGLKIHYYFLTGERKPLIETLNQMTVQVPYAPRPFTILAALYWQDGKVPLAEASARKAISLKEKTVLPHLLMGDILSSRKEFNQALSYYERVLEVQPHNFIALLQAGDLYLSRGEPKKAEERYRKALSVNPRVKSVQTKVAWAKAQGGDIEGALAMNGEYMRARPGDSHAVSAYANTLVAAKRLDEAIRIVQEAVRKNQRDWTLQFLLGDLFILKRDIANAGKSYEIALALNPSDINLALHIGTRYEENASWDQTERYYLNFLKKMPNNPLAANQLAWFYIEKMDSPQKAKNLVELLISEKDWPEIKDTIGWYYYQSGKYHEAESYFREGLRMAPERTESRARLALTLFSLNRNEEAFLEARKAAPLLAQGTLKNKLEGAMSTHKH